MPPRNARGFFIQPPTTANKSCVIHNTQKCQREEGEGELSVGNGGKSLIFLVFNAQEGEGGGEMAFLLVFTLSPPSPFFPGVLSAPVIRIRSFWCSKLYQSLTFGNLRGETPRPPLTTFSWFFT